MKKLDFICPICGGRLLVCFFETGSTDYIVSKNGKRYKNPIRKASKNCSSIDTRLICCENIYNRTCDFATDCDLELYDSPYGGEFEITETDDGYELYDLKEE